jgi:hypothetical protein
MRAGDLGLNRTDERFKRIIGVSPGAARRIADA